VRRLQSITLTVLVAKKKNQKNQKSKSKQNRCKQANEKALLDNFINEDEIELDNKLKELAEVVTKLNDMDAEN